MLKDFHEFLVKPGSKVHLEKMRTGYDGKMKKKHAKKELDAIHKRMGDLQYTLAAEKKQSLLIALQATDAGGKDGTIRDVMHGFNTQGCSVTPFRVPSDVERAHDYLWRIHKAVPPKGEIGIFNRSHYGDVLVVRVDNLVPRKQWSKRYDHINDFERMLADEGVRIIKFFLNISKDEQKRRFDKRLHNPLKHWKASEADFETRKSWPDYVKVHEVMLEKCSTKWAPWYVIPSDTKWYRNWVVGQIITKTLEEMDPQLPSATIDIEKYKKEHS